uniref:DUF243 domain-containing protein n=1 Tax=Timema monikensis TaxID=170555 RepID=A0A7R9ECL8_9NEOP|nr:unnamed protein product [Timema monikensis]
MRVLLVVASLAALVAARPEAGYSYNVPSQRYGSPFNGIFADRPSYNYNNGFNFGKGFDFSLLDGDSRLGVGGSQDGKGFDFSLLDGDSRLGVGGSREFTGANFIRGGLGGNFLGGGNGRGVVNLGGGDGGIGAITGGNRGVGGNGGGVLKTTSVYAHVAPPDFEEEIKAQQVIAPRQARINYKIVFIKAPTAPTPVNPIIPEFAQDQEKTLIYVLVKKPEEADDIVIPTPTPTFVATLRLIAARPEAGYPYNVLSKNYRSPPTTVIAGSSYNFRPSFDVSSSGEVSRGIIAGGSGFVGVDEGVSGSSTNTVFESGRGDVSDSANKGRFVRQNGIGAGAGFPTDFGAMYNGTGNYDNGRLSTSSVYFYSYPPDNDGFRPHRVIAPRQARINYKIVFIKAPTAPTPVNPIIPEFAQDQEKTLIYVLVKKPEEADDIVIPTPTPTIPSKPEVYFIKYKTQKQVSNTVDNVGFSGINRPSLYSGSPKRPSTNEGRLTSGYESEGIDNVGFSASLIMNNNPTPPIIIEKSSTNEGQAASPPKFNYDSTGDILPHHGVPEAIGY